MYKRNLLLFVISVSVICCLFGSGYAVSEEVRRTFPMAKLVFIIQPDKTEYHLGEKIVLRGILRNQSKTTLTVNSKFLLKGSEIEAGGWGIALKIVSPSDKKIEIGWLYEVSDPVSDWFVLLAPGKEYSSDIWGNIGAHCKETGTYRLTAYYYNFIGETLGIEAWKGSIESNTVKIHIRSS
jgi:hypothetical protein